MIQLDGASTDAADRLLVMGATNLPHNLDDAVLRRLSKRVYVPLPDPVARAALLAQLLPRGGAVKCALGPGDHAQLVGRTDGYSCSDLVSLCKEASMGPVRDMIRATAGSSKAVGGATPESVRPVLPSDFDDALRRIRPSVGAESLRHFIEWEREFAST